MAQPMYLSTDPNAGVPLTTPRSERYLSTDPNVQAEAEPVGDQLLANVRNVADFGLGAVKGAIGSFADMAGAISPTLGPAARAARPYLEPTSDQQRAGRTVEQVAEVAVPVGGALIGGARAVLPSAARAGSKFQSVMRSAEHVPVDIAKSGDVALRIQQLAERGGSMPKVVRDFLKRATDPAKGDLTYGEARDFLSNISRLSADEFKRLTSVVRREVGGLREALNEAVHRAASQVGKGDEYLAAMREYRRAARGREMKDTAVKYGVRTGLGALGLYGAGKALGTVD